MKRIILTSDDSLIGSINDSTTTVIEPNVNQVITIDNIDYKALKVDPYKINPCDICNSYSTDLCEHIRCAACKRKDNNTIVIMKYTDTMKIEDLTTRLNKNICIVNILLILITLLYIILLIL